MPQLLQHCLCMKYIDKNEIRDFRGKRMNIIIVGDGKVGYTIAEHLAQENHSITIIDKNEEALRKADESLDVMCVKGNGARISVLLEAGIKEADILIAVTSRDEMNMVCCLTAKRIANVRTVARIRDPEYFEEYSDLRENMGIDMIINPEYSAAYEIAKILQFPSAMNVENFFGGRVRMAEFRVKEDDHMLVGKKLSQLGDMLPRNILFTVAERGDEIVIPNGDFELHAGDLIYIMGYVNDCARFFKYIDRLTNKINTVMIVGGSRTAHYLTKIITRSGMSVKIIEQDSKKCMELSETLADAMIIEGDGTNQSILESENIEDVDAFITMMGRDEENLITAMYALDRGVDKVIAMTTRVNLPSIINKLGLDSVVSPKLVTAGYILCYVRGIQNSKGSVVESIYKIADGKAEVISFRANESTRFLDTPLRELKLKPETLIACIEHDGKAIIPHGNECIQSGDKVLVITKESHIIMDLNDIIA